MYKRIIAFFLTIATITTLVASVPAYAVGPGTFASGVTDFFGWLESMYQAFVAMDSYAEVSGFYDALDRETHAYCASADTATNGRSPYHYWGGALLPSNQSCDYCGLTYTEYKTLLSRGYGGFTSRLDSTTDSNDGVTVYGSGVQVTTDAGVANSYLSTIPIYSLANNAPDGSAILLSGNKSSISSVSSFRGFSRQYNSAIGVSVLNRYTTSSLSPYTNLDYPLGCFIDKGLDSFSNSSLWFSSSYGYPLWVCLNFSDALSVYHNYVNGEIALDGKYLYYLTPSSNFRIQQITESTTYGFCAVISECGQIEISSGLVTENVGCTPMFSNGGIVPSASRINYGLIPATSNFAPAYESATRPASLLQAISEYNSQFSIVDNSTNVNYYISPTGTDVTSDTISHPVLYDEETLVYTDPVTGTEYLTNGWEYDYLTRCYTLDMADDTFTIGDTVIDSIKLTYGDDVLTVDHYASGTLIQSDSYDYVMVSGSECSINGHAYTYETLKEPTCTSLGERKYTCSVCGDEYAENVPANGHTKVFSVMTEPTCTSSGIGVYTCSVCGTQASETIPATNHTPVVLEKVESEYDEHGTLITPGYTLYECSVCGTQYTVTDDVQVEEEGWFSWLTSLFKKLISSIVNGLASGLEWLIDKVIVTSVSWVIDIVEWVFGLFDGDSLRTFLDWFSLDNEAWTDEFSGADMFGASLEVAA